MNALAVPSLLTTLAYAGKSGISRLEDPRFQEELALCRDWGYRIYETPDRVALDFDHDQLVPLWIQNETPAIVWDCLKVHGFLRIGSTNNEAMEQARRGAPDGTLIFAEEQTSGKGRMNRTWFSPAGGGLYFTLVLRPKQPAKFWTLLTHMTSIALFETVKELMDHNIAFPPPVPDIKWPNDIMLSGKKCAGILCETLSLPDEDPGAVIGVGINVRRKSISQELEIEAACLDAMFNTPVPRRRLLVNFLRQFQKYYRTFEQGKHGQLLERWKRCSSMWNGVRIHISDGKTDRTATTCGLSEDGALLVQTDAGSIEKMLAGDISIRPLRSNASKIGSTGEPSEPSNRSNGATYKV